MNVREFKTPKRTNSNLWSAWLEGAREKLKRQSLIGWPEELVEQ
jgi:hypothetical protein